MIYWYVVLITFWPHPTGGDFELKALQIRHNLVHFYQYIAMISKMCFQKKNLLALFKVAKVTEGDKKMAVYYAKFKKN